MKPIDKTPEPTFTVFSQPIHVHLAKSKSSLVEFSSQTKIYSFVKKRPGF